MTTRDLTSSTTSGPITTSPSPTSTSGVFTTWPATTYSLATLTAWGSTPNGLGDFNLGDRIMQLVTGGSNGERVVRGFLMGVAIGIILGGAFCCWVPCFGRRRRERLARRRQLREEIGRQAVEQAQQQEGDGIGEQRTTPTDGTDVQQEPPDTRPNDDVPVSERSYTRFRWDRLRRRR